MNLRAPKDTPARNAARTLSTGAVAALLIMLGMDPALRLYDQHLLERPWIATEITLVVDPRNPVGPPDLLQETRAVAEVSGLRSSWVETERGIACGEQGQVLQPRGHDTVRWSWAGWFGACRPPPAERYRVCILYIVETRRQARTVVGPNCSNGRTAPAAG